jgi:DNA-binding CsgD family transcriptional regulator
MEADERRLMRGVWQQMIYRCHQSNHRAYKWYGARGIRVCEEWRSSFEAFASYMGSKPGPEYSIDRINNDGNYEPGNVRWATRSQQTNNSRSRMDGTGEFISYEFTPLDTGGDMVLQLDKRELEIVDLIARGFKTTEIATELGIGQRTVELRRNQIAQRIGIPTRMLVLWVGRHVEIDFAAFVVPLAPQEVV